MFSTVDLVWNPSRIFVVEVIALKWIQLNSEALVSQEPTRNVGRLELDSSVLSIDSREESRVFLCLMVVHFSKVSELGVMSQERTRR